MRHLIVAFFCVVLAACGSGGGGSESNSAPNTLTPTGAVFHDYTTVDVVTGLMWQKKDDNIVRTWSEADQYCQNLELESFTDWRLPETKELATIIKYQATAPSADPSLFPETNTAFYWSSTTDRPLSQNKKWHVDFSMGYIYSEDINTKNYVRCVRGETLTYSFTDNGNGTMTDNKTGLMWDKGYTSPVNWYQAAGIYDATSNSSTIDVCGNAATGGHTDWRLPTISELTSIMAFADGSSYYGTLYINTGFFSMPADSGGHFWSSTTPYEPNAWYARFGTGGIRHDAKTISKYVRCVR